ncbi:hypothetical protein C8Q80DRAFT_785379 [Daedaleopsis nitida]|nr:hypothetical protein C8Q80DRAFT_785379 [Daedaleopsis nitida]
MIIDTIMENIDGGHISPSEIYSMRITEYIQVSMFALTTLEVISTLPDEVAFIWPSDFTMMKMVFFANKYSVLVDITLIAITMLWTRDPASCVLQYRMSLFLGLIGVMSSEVILVARTVALWGHNRYIRAFFFGAYLALSLFAIYFIVKAGIWAPDISRNIASSLGCQFGLKDPDMWPAYAGLILGETGTVTFIALKRYREGHSSCMSWLKMITRQLYSLAHLFELVNNFILMKTLYRDGFLFYVVVLILSSINLLMMLHASDQLSTCMQLLLRVVHSAFSTRIFLNLRKASARSSGIGSDGATTQMTMEFVRAGDVSDISRSDIDSVSA